MPPVMPPISAVTPLHLSSEAVASLMFCATPCVESRKSCQWRAVTSVFWRSVVEPPAILPMASAWSLNAAASAWKLTTVSSDERETLAIAPGVASSFSV